MINVKKIIKDVRGDYKLQQIDEEWSEFLQIVALVQPSVVLEIGAYKGGSAACFAQLAKTVISIDQWVGRFDPAKIGQICKYHYIGINSHSNDATDNLKDVLGDKMVDVLFIDGDHTYNGAKYDFYNYKKFVRPGGIIGLHDILESKHHKKLNCHVYKLWKELQQKYNTITIIKNTEWGGIGVIKL